MKSLMIAVAVAGGALVAFGETLTFTNVVASSGQFTWANKENWLKADGTNKAPAEGDDLLIDMAINNFHAANSSAYVIGIHFTPNAKANGISWNGLYLKAGGDGLLFEPAADWSAYSTCFLDGTVRMDLKRSLWFQSGFKGRSSTQKGRVDKYGSKMLSGPAHADGNWTGATIHEGTFGMEADNGKTGIDFLFDAPATGARLSLRANVTLKDGGLESVPGLETTDFGVTGSSKTLTISGTPKSADEYFAGFLADSASFTFNPADAANTFTFAKANSTTVGNLTVANGTVRIADGASFPQLFGLSIGASGKLEIAADAGLVKAQELTLATGAVIDVGAGQELKVPVATLGGVALESANYTKDTCDWVTGEGKVVVGTPPDFVKVLTLDVPEGKTYTLQQALDAYNAASNTTFDIAALNGGLMRLSKIVKTGKGRLNMNVALPNFEGPVDIEAGILWTEVRYAIGKESNANAPVTVKAGATFGSATNDTNMNTGRTFHIAGTGASGYSGVLQCGSCGVSGNFSLGNVFGANVILDDDVTCSIGSWVYLGSGSLKFNGHKLTLTGGGSSDQPVHLPTLSDGGEIEVIGCELRNTGIGISGTESGRIVIGNKGGWRFADNTVSSANRKYWTFDFEGPNAIMYVDYNMQPRNSGNNNLDMTTILNTMVDFRYQGDRQRGYLKVHTAPTGTGGFSSPDNRTVFLHLLNPNNAFKGGLSFTRGTIWAYPNGSIPNAADAGAVTLNPTLAPYDKTAYNKDGTLNTSQTFHNTFDGIAFMTPDEYVLPDLVVKGTFPSRVQNGRGAWRRITAQNKGVDYYSGVGAQVLDVQKGYFKLPRGAQPGLWEGTNVCADATAATAYYNGMATCTNLAVRGPTSVIQRDDFNYTTWLGNEVMTYSGYIWNRSGESVTWTFANASKGAVTMKIDGETYTAAANTPTAATVTLTPGPHTFEWRGLNGGPMAATATWPKNFGFVYDRQGRGDVSNTNNFELCVDPGDGSLFTRTIDVTENLPVFASAHLADGTTFDVNGNRYVANDICGAGAVTNTATDASAEPKLVMKAMTIDAAKNETLKVDVPVELDANFTVNVTNVANRLRVRHTILTAKEAFTAPPAITVTADDGSNWCVERSADGKSLELCKTGLVIFIR